MRKRQRNFISWFHSLYSACFCLLLSGIFIFLSFKPELLIKNLEPGYQIDIARKLLFILAVSSPIVVGQRMLQMIFCIRLQEYYIQLINIVGSLTKIMSVFYFFGFGRYNIVGYFIFLQFISLLVVLAGLWLAKIKYDYDFKLLFKRFKFSKGIFNKTKGLAFSSLFCSIMWILYYEMDSIAIGKIIGIEAVAIYAIGLTLLSFFRSILGVFFTPFSARFNHFIGLGKENEFRSFYNHVVTIMLPLVVFPIVAVVIMAKGLTISWVGIDYTESVVIVQFLIFCNILGFISYPAGMMLMAREKIKHIYFINALIPVIFWAGIILSIKYWGVETFAIFKIIAFVISGFVYLWLSLKFMCISVWKFLKNTIIPYLPGLIVMSVLLYLMRDYCVDDKNRLNLLYNLVFIAGGCVMAFAISMLTAKQFRQYILSLIPNTKK